MNEILQSMKMRKSVRVYEDRPIGREEKRAILEAALQAPTAGNMTLYTILDITDQSLKDRLAVTCDNQPFIAKAPLVLIFCGDYRRWYDVYQEYGTDVRKPGEGDMIHAMIDAVIAAQNAVMAAESFGIGSCYIGDILENYEIHQELLHLPDHVVPACMLCFGYPTRQQKDRVKPTRFHIEDIVHENGYDKEKSARMKEMLLEHEHVTEDRLPEHIRKFCQRKWNSDFSREMTRSCKEMLKSWTKE